MMGNTTLRTVLLAALVLAVFGGGFLLGGRDGKVPAAHADNHDGAAPTVWTCSMHPQIQLPTAGQCPICFMDLIPLEADTGGDEGPRSLVMSESAAALAEIRTVAVERRSVASQVRMVGTVAYDETRYRTITAWVPGRIDRLYLDFTGTTVAAGERLASLYSADLVAAQTELLSALAAHRDVSRSASPLVRETSAATIESARRRLRLWGVGDDQIAAVESAGTVSDHVEIRSTIGGVVVHKNAVEGLYVDRGAPLYTVADLDRVWVEMEAYENDLAWLRTGQEVAFTARALPGEELRGEIIFIDPVLDTRKRTARVRVAADNGDGRLKPGMYVSAVAAAGDGDRSVPLVIPASAPLVTGKRAVVYVRLPGRDRPTFEGREVELGRRAGDDYVVASGLAEGELVVVHGAFKIDSALQIQAKPSMMNPDGGGPMPGHDHGGQSVAAAGSTPPHGDGPFAAPGSFRTQLSAVLAAYLEAQTALAADEDGAARAAAAGMVAALEAVDMTLLEGEAHLAWMRDLKPLRAAAGMFASAGGMADRRGALQSLSGNLWRTLNRFGVAGDATVRRFHCPMANNDQGAYWLQLSTETANPYFGASMLRCGSQSDTLAAAGTGEER